MRGWWLLLAVAGCAAPLGPKARAERKLQAWRDSRVALRDDFGELRRYREEDAQMPAHGPQVVFYGDSITELWKLDEAFPGKPYVNRGIAGQTTAQLLLRFRQDVVALQPSAVVILAGTNDLAGNTGPMSLEETEGNLASMAELGQASRIHVVLCSVLPVHDYTPASERYFVLRPPGQIVALNRWIRSYCEAHGCTYVDYFGAVVDERGLLQQALADDGLHPNAEGYRRMAPLVQQALDRLAPALPIQ